MRFLNEREARLEITRRVESGGVGRFAVAFWGGGAAARLGIEGCPDKVEIVCNLTMGGTNPTEIEHLIDLGVSVRHCDQLHSKVYLFDDAVILGSSNASSNGLAFQEGEAGSWIEANVISEDSRFVAEVSRWWSRLPSRPVTPKDIALARTAWTRRRTSASLDSSSTSLLAEMRRSPTFFDGKQVFLAIYGTPLTKEGETGLAEAQADFGAPLYAFEDWAELPPEGHLVCFWRGPRGGIASEGIYERRLSPPDRKLTSGSLQLCWETPDFFGLKVTSADIPEWKLICDRIRASEYWDEGEGCALVNLEEVSRRFLD